MRMKFFYLLLYFFFFQGKRGRGINELSMPVSVFVDDCQENERIYVLDPGNSRIKCLTYDGKFLGHLGMN